MNLLMPWRWPKLDQQRTQAARRHFDETGQYDGWHQACRTVFNRTIPDVEDSFGEKGMEIVRILSPLEAAATKLDLLKKSTAFVQKKRAIDYADTMHFADLRFLRPILERMFNEDVDAKIRRFYGSEYFVQSVVANRTMPAKVSKRSFLWHGDRGPKNFLKINMFLDATSEHGGTTEFLNLEDSLKFESAGYTFGANDRRVSDLSLIGRKIGCSAKVVHPDLDAGEAFVFLPSRVLHRGFLPTTGIRHMLLVIVLPSPVHWTKAWDRMCESGYFADRGEKFDDQASTLFEVVGAPAVSLSK